MTAAIDALPPGRAALLAAVRQRAPVGAPELAELLGTSRESVRQHLATLEAEGWVRRAARRRLSPLGRPTDLYVLTSAGETLFPKAYPQLMQELLSLIGERCGDGVMDELLAALTDRRVAEWAPRLAGLPLPERIRALTDVYFAGDPYTHIERDERGWLLVERNCPYLEVALAHPRLCSVTVSMLSRLLGVAVTREARFQDGAQRCSFRVHADRPVDEDFRFAPEPANAPADAPAS